MPTEGKNFLQPTFLVVLGLSLRFVSVSTVFSTTVSFVCTDAAEIAEFSSSVSTSIGVVLAVSTFSAGRALRFLVRV